MYFVSHSARSFTALVACFALPFFVSAESSRLGSTTSTNLTHVVETSVLSGSQSTATDVETFFATTYSGFSDLKSTIHTETVITLVDGDSTKTTTYSYDIGPGGIGWTIPTVSKDEPILAQPTTLPKSSSVTSRSVTIGHTSRTTENPSTSSDNVKQSTTSFSQAATSIAKSTDTSTGVSTGVSTGISTDTSTGTPTGTPTGISTGISTGTSTRTSTGTLAHTLTDASTDASTGSPKPITSLSTSSTTSLENPSSGDLSSSGIVITTSTTTRASGTAATSTSGTSTNSTGPIISTGGLTSSHSSSISASSTSSVSSDSSTASISSGSKASSLSPSSSSGVASSTTDILTSTITSAPSGFTGITLQATTFTADDWITTTDSNHHTTLLPLIILGGGRAVALWDLPSIPNVEFSLPDLPKFHLPCVKVFGISVGSCSSPPDNDGPPDNSSPSPSPSDSPSPSRSPSPSASLSSSPSPSPSPSPSTSPSASPSSSPSQSSSAVSTSTVTTSSSTSSSSSSTSSEACSATPAKSFAQATQMICGGKCLPGTQAGSNVPSFSTSGPDPTPDYRKRAIAGRITMDPLMKRANPSAISSLGGCPLATPAGQPLNLPGWPGIYSAMLQPEQAGTMDPKYDVISRYDRATNDGCVFTTTRLSADDFINAPTWQDYSGNSFDDSNNRGSLDHAYEKSWLKQFFNKVISSTNGPNALTCDQTNQYFFPKSTSCTLNLLQDIWDQLAGDDNLKFVAMSQYLNGNAKGMFFPPAGQSFEQAFVNDSTWLLPTDGRNWVWPSNGGGGLPYSAQDALYTMIQYFETVLYGVLELKTDNMLQLIDDTNNGIYGELLSYDSLIGSNPGTLFGDTGAFHAAFPSGIAGAYKDFMTATIEPQVQLPPKYLTNLWENRLIPALTNSYNLPDVSTNPNNQNEPGQYRGEYDVIYNLLAAHNAHYVVSGTPSWNYDFSFSWSESGSGSTKKRDVSALLKRAGSCPLPTDSTTASSSSSATGSSSTTDSSSTTALSSGATSSSKEAPSTTTHAGTTSTSITISTQTTQTATTAAQSTTACSFVTTTFPASLQSIAPGVQRYCTCGETMAGINMATSGTSTITYCALGSPVPTGFTQIPVTNGVPVTTTSSSEVPSTSVATASPSTTDTPAATTASACVGNQIEGSCVQATLPSSTPNSGSESPVCMKVDADGSNYVRFNASQASQAASEYCSNLVSGGTVINSQNTSPSPGTVNGAAENGGYISLNILFDVNVCDEGTSTSDQQVDFAALGQDTCYQYLYTALAQVCVEDPSWPNYDPNYTLQGGVWGGSCALWSMQGLSGS